MNRSELIRIVVLQFSLVVIAGAVAAGLYGISTMLSVFAGGLSVAVPNFVFALYLLRCLKQRRPAAPLAVLISEFIKMASVCVLFVLVAKLFPTLNWPAMIFGIIAAAFSSVLLIFNQR